MHYKFNVSPLLKDYELRNPPVVIRVNKFDEESAREFMRKMGMAHNTGQKVIPIIIDSYGGQVYSLMSMIACINAAELPVATIIEGKAMSCGAALFSFGEDGMRYMDKDATIMIHEVSSATWGKNEEIQASAEETKRLNEKILKMMARNCGKDEDFFLKKIHDKGHADWFIESDEAISFNLANHTKLPKIEIDIGVDIKLV